MERRQKLNGKQNITVTFNDSPHHVRQSGFQNPGNLQNPGNFFFVNKYQLKCYQPHLPELCLSFRVALKTNTWAQLFEGRLALNPGLNLTLVFFLVFKSIFSDNFLCYF